MPARIASILVIAGAVACASCAVSHELQNMEPIGLTSGIISGTVTDSLNQQPITGAELTLLTADGDSLKDQQAKTFSFSPRGEYRFTDVRPGSYALRASAAGYQTVITKVGQLSAGERFTVSFALRRND